MTVLRDLFWEPRVGDRCRVARMHHPVFEREVGQVVIVTRVHHHADGASVWATPDREIRRTLRNGREVVERPNWQTVYGVDQLEPAAGPAC